MALLDVYGHVSITADGNPCSGVDRPNRWVLHYYFMDREQTPRDVIHEVCAEINPNVSLGEVNQALKNARLHLPEVMSTFEIMLQNDSKKETREYSPWTRKLVNMEK